MTPAEQGAIPPPSALALVLCEGIWTDLATGKKTLLGCFTGIGAHQFPAIQPLLSAYVLLTNGRGKAPFKVVILDVDEEREPVAEINGEIEFPDVRAVVAIEAVMMGLKFPAAGEYRLQVWVAGEFIIERSILVSQVQ